MANHHKKAPLALMTSEEVYRELLHPMVDLIMDARIGEHRLQPNYSHQALLQTLVDEAEAIRNVRLLTKKQG
jgi:hypothetical protein